MENRARGVRLLMALVMMMSLLVGAAHASADTDPIRVSSLSEPQSVISEQEVDITIKIYNSSQTDIEGSISLYDSNGGYPIQTYNGLKGENSVTYTGTWNVTQEEIDAGKIKYYIRYTVDTESGPQQTTRTIPVTIQAEEAAPQLSATYSVSPTAAKKGQTVTLTYTLSNTGNVELRNIVIANDGVTDKDVTAAALSVGEKITLTDTFTMGSKELVSKPEITYQAADSSKKLTISDMARKTITVAEDGLDVTIKADKTEDVYPGEAVTFTLTMKNSGNAAYSDLGAMLADGTVVASGVELAPGASYEGTFTYTPTEKTAIGVTVSGSDSAGESVAVVSNEIALTTTDPTRALILDVSAQVEKNVIYSEPAVLRFAVTVKNVGQTDATNLTIEQAGTKVATIPSLPYGESRTLVFDLQTSIAGQFRFDVIGRDAESNEKTYSSNVMQVTYVEPTPAPTATPEPTATPVAPTPEPTATPMPSIPDMIKEYLSMPVLYTVAGVLAGLLALILGVNALSASKRKKRLEGAIDTIEITSDVRNHTGGRKGKKGKKAKQEKASDKVIVPAEDLDDLDDDELFKLTPKRQAAPQSRPAENQAEEGRRRRGQQEPVVPADETLRVVPVDQRPDFVAQGKVDDSRTRKFGKVTEEAPAPAAPAAPQEPAEETIRLDRESVEEIKRREEQAESKKGKRREDIKPMKKKRGLFGKKQDEDDDMFADEDDDSFYDDDDEFFE